MNQFEEAILISAPIETVWEVLADIGSIHVWHPGVKHSKQTTSGNIGVGSGRHCNLGGKNYLDEEVIEFTRPNKLSIKITGTNMPFDESDVQFLLQSQGDQTEVKVIPRYELKFGLLGKLLNFLMVGAFYRKGMQALLKGLKEHVEK